MREEIIEYEIKTIFNDDCADLRKDFKKHIQNDLQKIGELVGAQHILTSLTSVNLYFDKQLLFNLFINIYGLKDSLNEKPESIMLKTFDIYLQMLNEEKEKIITAILEMENEKK